MSVIPVTVFFSLGLVFFFVVLFLREHRRRLFASAERDSLLPLAAELPRLAGDAVVPVSAVTHAHDGHGAHRHGPEADAASAGHDSRCGCARGERPPCAGCARTAARSSL